MVDPKKEQEPSASARKLASKHNDAGLQHYGAWEMEEAISAFQDAAKADADNPEYHLNLARAYARSNAFDKAMRSLGEYLRTETDEHVATRYERLFSSALDGVEELVIERMRKLEMPIEHIGKALQMWLEYRITVGRRPLRVPKPELWAAALTYAVGKINLAEISREEIADAYGISERSLRDKYRELLETLDLVPCDYRYFTDEENPLDKLVEAAQLLEDIYARFREA